MGARTDDRDVGSAAAVWTGGREYPAGFGETTWWEFADAKVLGAVEGTYSGAELGDYCYATADYAERYLAFEFADE